ncbi:type II secretion system F family protein [Kineosporia babensis]|uniref:Type II secretion system F family protein n=1 Tax=Kineosporia babensis TaxID=499548 RepID=A0A9X1SSE6_9ACTN|nr:type II secretion system F family protein [Kineosporia babensis]MCD5310211.1 type II secretion system F family protein [Kineosporia babensis]
MLQDLSTGPALAMLAAGALVGAGLALLIDALVRRERHTGGTDTRTFSDRTMRRIRGFGTRLPIAVLAGVFTLLITAWPVASIAAVVMILAWPALMGGAREERQQAERLEALALWTESLRDTIAGAVGLEQAVIATSRAAPAPIADEIVTLADRLRVRVPLPTALHRLADDLNDASADLVVAALLLNSRLRGPGLRHVLTSLSESVRAEVEMRGRVTAGRAATRRSVQIVVAVTLLFVLGLRTFNPGYVEPYQHPAGQVVLAIVVAFFAAGFFWLKQLAAYDLPERFMHSGVKP